MHPNHLTIVLAGVLLILLFAPKAGAQDAADEPAFPWVGTQGTQFVDPSGEPVILRGCNVGNWLLLEMWMLAIDHGQFPDQYAFEHNLAERFGEAEKDRLMEVYRTNWVTPRDFELIRSFGFNVIRLPFNYRLLEDDENPGELKPDAFKWLDRAIEMCEDAGLYVILDMHAVPGGQSVDHPTGRVEQNHLWDDPAYATRTAQLWQKIAARYKDRPSVAGYDVINEPYSDFNTDVRAKLRPIFEEIYHAIREVDARHIVFAPAPLWGGHGFYGDPHENGWTNVAFTEHHYPGLFGSEPSGETHINFIEHELPAKQAEYEAVQTPMFVGEWNPVFERLGGGDLMRRYFDEYAAYGWAATIWSYKILHKEGGVIDDNWYMVSNAEPLDAPNFETASIEEIESYFEWFGTMDYVIDEPMRLALTRPDAVPVVFPEPEPKLTTPPHTDDPGAWTATDIGGALPGGQRVADDGGLTVYGAGRDIWGSADQFRLLWRDVDGDFQLTATVTGLHRTNQYAKAGLMVRADLSPGSPHVLLHAFPNGEVVLGRRDEAEGNTTQIDVASGDFPVRLRLTRRGDTITAMYTLDGTTWQPAGEPIVNPALSGRGSRVGLAVLSHDAAGLTEATFTDVELKQFMD